MSDSSYLNDIISDSTTTIKEKLFVNKYLPMVFDKDPGLFNMAWLNEVCGNPHVRVYVVDEMGTVLFSVPPLRLSPIAGNSPEIVESLQYVQMVINNNGMQGHALLTNTLPELISVQEADRTELQREWKVICDRYGYGDRCVDTVTEAIEELHDDFNYDLSEW